jgi:hypothetical protein
LGFFLTKANQLQEAITALHKALELYPGYPQRLAIIDIIAGLQGDIEPQSRNEAINIDRMR